MEPNSESPDGYVVVIDPATQLPRVIVQDTDGLRARIDYLGRAPLTREDALGLIHHEMVCESAARVLTRGREPRRVALRLIQAECLRALARVVLPTLSEIGWLIWDFGSSLACPGWSRWSKDLAMALQHRALVMDGLFDLPIDEQAARQQGQLSTRHGLLAAQWSRVLADSALHDSRDAYAQIRPAVRKLLKRDATTDELHDVLAEIAAGVHLVGPDKLVMIDGQRGTLTLSHTAALQAAERSLGFHRIKDEDGKSRRVRAKLQSELALDADGASTFAALAASGAGVGNTRSDVPSPLDIAARLERGRVIRDLRDELDRRDDAAGLAAIEWKMGLHDGADAAANAHGTTRHRVRGAWKRLESVLRSRCGAA